MLASPQSMSALSSEFHFAYMLVLANITLHICIQRTKWMRQMMRDFKDAINNDKGPPRPPSSSGSIVR